MRRMILPGAGIALCLLIQGCLNLNTSGLLSSGTPFVVQGTMTLGGRDGSCLVWQADNGVSYYLYQDPLLDNSAFDRVNTAGVTSRLVLVTRTDLTSPCPTDKIAQVQEVLEVF